MHVRQKRDRILSVSLTYHAIDTRLADHTAALAKAHCVSAESRPAEEQIPTPKSTSSKHAAVPLPIVPVSLSKSSSPAPGPDAAAVIQLRQDLASAQNARSTLTTANTDLTARLATLTSDIEQLQDQLKKLKAQYASQSRRLKDRDSELVEKRKMLERVQDEIVGLEMQLNVSEQEKERLRNENEGLVKRLVRESDEIVARRVEKGG